MSKSEKLELMQLRDDAPLLLAFVGDRFKYIEKIMDELDAILDAHLWRHEGIRECFQRAYMEIENTRDEISHQLRKYTNKEHEEED